MPLRLNIGLSKKLGLPDYGSLGASCNVDIELDAALLQTDPEAFQRHARNAYDACRRAVQEELARHQAAPSSTPTSHSPATAASTGGNGNGHSGNGNGHANGNGTNGNSHGQNGNGRGNGHPASEKQMTYVRQLAGHIKGLGVRRLEALADKMFGKPVAGLTSLEASGLIDALKGIKAGEIDLDTVLGGAATP
ncbi:MAG TPA: hypothetical protein PLF81_24440 [Candidatus Anammoximicrobium sp.]|nr:hypothetical protein [Candidatus Anammoximicrobium sp.]